MRVVLDTNVIISALLFDGLPERLLLGTFVGPHQLIISSYILEETNRILESKFSVKLQNLELLQRLLSEGELVHFQPFLNILKDEPDNRILETAIKGSANFIVTGDKQLLEYQKHEGIRIVTVKNYLETIDNL